jgi:hypothetical protein
MYLATIYISTEFLPDRTLNMAALVAILENQLRAITGI